LADDGTTFTDLVLDERLARAHRMLSDPKRSELFISAIAYEAGFGDLSYFNRTFRRRYGASPSDVRETAKRDSER
jgi:AraC-like DNA-binding protein